ncbi:MAG TPA: glycosyltransferase family 4 protein [Acidimicrobiales bacterium]|jgi:glycosyltransferase involved in cell wall biosynthesis
MRVLMVSQFYPPVVGGQERHVRTLSVGLVGRGHEVDVVTTAVTPGDVGVDDDEGVRVHRVRTTMQRLPGVYQDPARAHAIPLSDPVVARWVSTRLARGRYDVVHAHDWMVGATLGPARRAKVPILYTLHDYSHLCTTKRLMRDDRVCGGPGLARCVRCAARQHGALVGAGLVGANLVAHRLRARGVARFIPVSSAVARGAELEPGSYEVIPNFIGEDLVEPHLPVHPDGPVVFVGDLTRDKGVEVLVEAYRGLVAPPPLVLAGRQFDHTPIRIPPNGRLAGVLPYREVLSLIASASVVVVPSIVADCCPTVVLEAMAKGRPVIGAASGGIADLVEDGVTGVLVPPGDPGALAKAMANVLEDHGRAASMGAAATRRVRGFTGAAVIGRIENLYARVAAAPVSQGDPRS